MADSTLASGASLGPHWKVISLVGEGACGKVYSVAGASQESSDTEFVAKCIPYGKGLSKTKAKVQERVAFTLNFERSLLAPGQLLSDFRYRPVLPRQHYYGKDEDTGVVYLVMERFKCDLTSWARERETNLTTAHVAHLGLQLLDGLKWLHDKGYLFIDVKPDNFMLRENDSIVFIDWGLALRLRGKLPTALVGTPAFVSLAVLEGAPHSRRDELESLVYVLLSLCNLGRLPWSNATTETDLLRQKKACDIIALASSYQCSGLGEFITENRTAPAEGPPDYAALKAVLEDMKKANVTIRGNEVFASDMGSTKAKNGSKKRGKAAGPVADTTSMDTQAGGGAVQSSRGRGRKPQKTDSKSLPKRSEPSRSEEKAADVPSPESSGSNDENISSLLNSDQAPKQARKPTQGKRKARTAQQKKSDEEGTSAVSTPKPKPKLSKLRAAVDTAIRLDSPPRRSSLGRLSTSSQNAPNALSETLMSSWKSPAMSRSRRSSRNSFERASISEKCGSMARERSSLLETNTLYLTVMDGPHKGDRFPMGSHALESGAEPTFRQLLIGRGDDADISLSKDQHISENHMTALWSWDPSGELDLNVQDRSSTNGTAVNDVDLEAKEWRRVYVGDEVCIGETLLRLEVENQC
jgi:serine/threonine protein kinase